jgi:TolB-like protein/DNA-binding SARP family transcriptional activator
MLRLITFGSCAMMRDERAIESLSAQRRALAVLAMVASAGPLGVSRDLVAARLWPESDESRARLSLRQVLHLTHAQLGEPELLGSGPDLRLDPARCTSDVGDFRQAIAAGDHAIATALYTGPFLSGFHLRRAPAVEEWIEDERREIARLARRAFERLAAVATESGAPAEAVEHWRRLVTMEPLSGRLSAGYMRALAAAGDRAAALRHARVHELMVRSELETAPDAVVRNLAEELRSSTAIESSKAGDSPAAGSTAAVLRDTSAAHATAGQANLTGTAGSTTGAGIDIPATSETDQPAELTAGPLMAVPGDAIANSEGLPAPSLRRRGSGRSRWSRAGSILLPMTVAAVLALFVLLQSNRLAESPPASTVFPPPDPAWVAPSSDASVAVLPFTNLTADAADEYASDGLTDELIGTLGRVPGLQVIARTSVFAFRNRGFGARTIADTLGVEAIVEGSWRRDGTRLRVTAQLVRAKDEAVLWAGRYDRTVGDVLAVQDEIARAITAALLPNLDVRSAAVVRPASIGTSDPLAHELYLRGRQAFFSRTTPGGILQARTYFLQAIARDSQFARAHAGLSDAATRLAVFGHAPPAAMFREAKRAADRALALDSTLVEAHASRGHALYVADFAWAEAEQSFRKALALDPAAVFARAPFAIGLYSQGRFDEALAQLFTARAIDPLSPAINNVLGRVQIAAGQHESALQTLTAIVELDPRQDLAWRQLGHVHLLRGDHRLAVAAFERAAALSGARDSAHLAYAHAVGGNPAEARRILRRLEGHPVSRDQLAVHFAIAHAGLGDQDRAFFWLERGYELRASFIGGVAVERALVNLHDDSRWAALLQRMGLLHPGQ